MDCLLAGSSLPGKERELAESSPLLAWRQGQALVSLKSSNLCQPRCWVNLDGFICGLKGGGMDNLCTGRNLLARVGSLMQE